MGAQQQQHELLQQQHGLLQQQAELEQELGQKHKQVDHLKQQLQAASLERVRWHERATSMSERLHQLDSVYRAQTEDQQQTHDQMVEQLQALQADLARERQARSLESRHAEEKLELLETNKTQLLKEFEGLSGKIFEQKQQQFSRQSELGIQRAR